MNSRVTLAQLLHSTGVVALTLIVAVALGRILGNTPDEASNRKDLFEWHRWIGLKLLPALTHHRIDRDTAIRRMWLR